MSFKEAWHTESTTTSLPQQFVVESRVVVARDGGVLSATITKPSGNLKVDGLVEKILESVKHVPPFPATVTDAQKTCIIVFTAKPKT